MKFTRQRYQSGSLSREVRKAGPAAWIFRWRENATEGRVYRKVVVGTIEQFPTKTAAKRAVNISLHDQRGQSRSARDLKAIGQAL